MNFPAFLDSFIREGKKSLFTSNSCPSVQGFLSPLLVCIRFTSRQCVVGVVKVTQSACESAGGESCGGGVT